MARKTIDLATHEHDSTRRPLNDARGIFCTYVCDRCERQQRAKFRPEVFTDAAYETDEPIDEC